MKYIGIDGGGSKTVFLLADDHHQELDRFQTGPSNWLSVGKDAAAASIREGAAHFAGIAPDAVCGGFAGAGRHEGLAFYRSVLEPLFPSSRVRIESDAVVAYAGALGLVPGVLLIAGTGSIAIGRKTDGTMVRAGGWGPQFGDEGSGFWIGREAVRAALRALDADAGGDFPQRIAEALRVTSVRDVIAAWSNGTVGVPEIASLAPVVLQSWPNEPSAGILRAAGNHLRSMVEIAVKKVAVTPCPVCAAGSVASSPRMRSLIGIEFCEARQTPEWGAVVMAQAGGAAN